MVDGLGSGAADRDGDGLVSVEELYRYIHDEVRRRRPEQRPMRWVLGEEGELTIAKNSHPVVPELPGDIEDALCAHSYSIRLRAVEDLGLLLRNRRRGWALGAGEALKRLAGSDQDQRVRDGARLALGESPLDVRPAPRRQRRDRRASSVPNPAPSLSLARRPRGRGTRLLRVRIDAVRIQLDDTTDALRRLAQSRPGEHEPFYRLELPLKEYTHRLLDLAARLDADPMADAGWDAFNDLETSAAELIADTNAVVAGVILRQHLPAYSEALEVADELLRTLSTRADIPVIPVTLVDTGHRAARPRGRFVALAPQDLNPWRLPMLAHRLSGAVMGTREAGRELDDVASDRGWALTLHVFGDVFGTALLGPAFACARILLPGVGDSDASIATSISIRTVLTTLRRQRHAAGIFEFAETIDRFEPLAQEAYRRPTTTTRCSSRRMSSLSACGSWWTGSSCPRRIRRRSTCLIGPARLRKEMH